MFFRRVFSRKDSKDSSDQSNDGHFNSLPPSRSQSRLSGDEKRNLSVLQLTPLWEHIIRTKCLPKNINEKEMFEEFTERLKDPEWQVRQHGLRVLIDVLIVMGPRCDQFMHITISSLVENLGHSAPAVRKGGLDALKVYMTETAMPETVILDIISLGMDRKCTSEQLDGRVCIGVMLSLPSLVHTAIGSAKQIYILRAAIDALTGKMVQVTFQEIAVKVLVRIREMIGVREFSEYIAHNAYREFELLCNVYGFPTTPTIQHDPLRDLYIPQSTDSKMLRNFPSNASNENNNCKIKRTELQWRDPDDNETIKTFQRTKNSADCTREKLLRKKSEDERVIMETEIKIDNTAVMMRILEASDGSKCSESDRPGEHSEEDDSSTEKSVGIVRILTDSDENYEIDKNMNPIKKDDEQKEMQIKRVTFGGEEVKLRTPDSDSVLQSDSDDLQKNLLTINIIKDDKPVEKPVSPRPKTASEIISSTSNSNTLAVNRLKSASPIKRTRRASYSSTDERIVSPKVTHKGIEVLHNLQQRSPSISPARSRQNSLSDQPPPFHPIQIDDNKIGIDSNAPKISEKKLSWESLGLVSDECFQNIKSGDWRLRSSAMLTIEEMLKSPENLYRIQPYLESFLRILLLSEKHPDVAEEKRRILINLISRLPLENLECRTAQIMLGICRQGGAGGNHVLKSLMQRLPPTVVLHKLISDDFLKARGAKFRENALQMILYSLMTFPSTYFDLSKCVEKATDAANDRKKRVRQAALDVLAVLGQISSPKIVMDEVIRTKNDNDNQDSNRLITAIKARLSRKQLPTVTPDGSVQYALRIPTPPNISNNYFFGADIDWITAGVGSVSPTSLKHRNDFIHQSNNYSSSDSNGYPDNFRPTKDISVLFRSNREHGFDYDNGTNRYSNEIMTAGHHKEVNDDKNSHFVIATTIPMNNRPSFLFPGALHKASPQSQSFPDLTGNGKSFKDDSNRALFKSSKLPVASRFPSMESNMEARTNTSRTDLNSLIGGSTNVYSNQRFNHGMNRTILRKNLNSNIPIRSNFFQNSSHAVLEYQSSNDESRPITHPIEGTQSIQKRFINVNKYFNDKSDESSSDKSPEHFKFKDKKKISNDEEIVNDTNAQNEIQRNAYNVQSINDDRDKVDNSLLITELADLAVPEVKYLPSPIASPHLSDRSNGNGIVNDEHIISANLDANGKEIETISLTRSSASTTTIKSILPDEIDNGIVEQKSPGSGSTKSFVSTESVDSASISIDDKEFISMKIIETKTNETVESIPEIHLTTPRIEESIDNRDEEKTHEIHIKNAPEEVLIQNEFAPNDKPHSDPDETKTESDTRSFTSTEDTSSEYNSNIASKALLEINKKSSRAPPLLGRNKIRPMKQMLPIAATVPKSVQMFSSNLRKFDKPRDAANNCLTQLDNANWETTMNGLQLFVRLIRHHPEMIEANFHAFCVALAKQVKNLRSQVSRSACQASAEFFQTHSKQMEQEPDDLATQLFNRTADTNKFLRGDAARALDAMCDNLSPQKVIQTIVIRGANHQNAIVRTAAAKLCTRIVSRLGHEKVFSLNREYRDKFIVTGANFLMEGSLETRNSAKVIFKQLSAHPNYQRILFDVIPQRTYRNIEKALKSIK